MIRLENFIPRIDCFLPIIAGRKEYQASIKNPTERDLENYGENFREVSKRDSEIHEVKRVAMSGFFALAVSPLAGLGVWAIYSYILGTMTNIYSKQNPPTKVL